MAVMFRPARAGRPARPGSDSSPRSSEIRAMKIGIVCKPNRTTLALVVAVLAAVTLPLGAQDRLKTMPGYEQYQKMSGQISGSVKSASLDVAWKDGGKAFEYKKDGKTYRYDIAARKAEEIAA